MYASGRLSPGGLERRMAAELNLMESMEESMRQLTDVERTRAVSMAQQETVSLAQILKVIIHFKIFHNIINLVTRCAPLWCYKALLTTPCNRTCDSVWC